MPRAVLTSKVVFLTGAGASVPLGLPDTKRFLDDFFRVDCRDLAAGNPDLQEYLSALEREAVAGGWDVENMLDVLQGDRKAADRLALRPLFLKRALNGNPAAVGPFVAATDAILELLQDKLIEHFSEIDAERAADLYRPILEDSPDWFSDIPNFGRTVLIFTLNYDVAVESAATVLQRRDPERAKPPVRLVDGLIDETGAVGRRWSQRAFYDYRAQRGRSNVVLVKLHGSVRWGRSTAQPGVIAELALHVGRDPGSYETLVLYPTAGPKPIEQEPFHTGYRLLAACLGHTRLLVAIGTSFRDAELCLLIRDAMEDNPLLRLVVVGPGLGHTEAANRVGVSPAKVAGLRTKFTFPTHGKYDHPDRPTYQSLMGGVRELARAAYDVKQHPGNPRFGATSIVSEDGLWREDRADS